MIRGGTLITHFASTAMPLIVAPARPTQRLAYLSSFPPRQCGIATFTRDLKTAIDTATKQPGLVVAMNDRVEGYAYPNEVALQIERNDRASYSRTARRLAQMPIDLINVQHEYGLFGGAWGDYLLDFYKTARQPIVTTLHSVLPGPNQALREVTRALADNSAQVIVLAKAAIDILTHDYGIARNKLRLIPHGIPTVPMNNTLRHMTKTKLGFAGRTVLSTFGLISPNKGLEFAVNALPDVVKAHPDALYLIIGQTHPGVRASEGEAYRVRLQTLAHDLGLAQHVAFVDQYLALPQLIEYLVASDLYIVPYQNPTQIVSGTLAYAMGCGRAVISTPFIHAREALANGNGVLVPFNDSTSMGHAITNLLDHPSARAVIEQNAYAASRTWVWPAVAKQYTTLFEEVTQYALSTATV